MSTCAMRPEAPPRVYWKDGQPYVSVTHVLSHGSKAALVPWAVRTALTTYRNYLEAVLDTSSVSYLDLDAAYAIAENAPNQARDTAKDAGLSQHKLLDSYLQGKPIDLTSLPRAFANNWAALATWLEKVRFNVLATEQVVFNDEHHYAGTLDCVAELEVESVRRVCLLDWKFTGGVYPSMGYQLSAYREAYQPNGLHPRLERQLIVQVKDGKVHVHDATDKHEGQFRAFLGLLAVCREEHPREHFQREESHESVSA